MGFSVSWQLHLKILAQHLLIWAPVPPVIAITFFERRYDNDPIVLQYAHRVLAQHPVELAFFFVPQVVQALRYDELGTFSTLLISRYRLSFVRLCETFHLRDRHDIAAVLPPNHLEHESQLLQGRCCRNSERFFHTLLDALNDCSLQEDSLKPTLEEMMNSVVAALSGEARDFYDREFAFFEEVTSISGKLKPYIKKTKSEKKVCASFGSIVLQLTTSA
jgi:phosphatidylinositol 4-kinase A